MMGDCCPLLKPKLMEDVRAIDALGQHAGGAKAAPLDVRTARVCEGWPVRTLFDGQIGSLDSKGAGSPPEDIRAPDSGHIG